MSSQQPVLTPWLTALRADVAACLRALLGLPPAVALAWQLDPRRPGVHFVLDIGEVPNVLTLALGELDAARNPQWRGRRWSLEVRGRADAAVTAALMRRLDGLDAGSGEHSLFATLRSLHRHWQPVRDRRDEDFRTWSASEAMLRLGFRCNQDCDFCWQGRDWPQPPLALLHTWLAEMLACHPRQVVLSGGEPTLYMAELHELAMVASAAGVPVFVQSNAIRLSQPHVLAQLLQAGVTGALLSYHSGDPAVSDAVTLAPGTHYRTEQGIAAALRAGLRVDLNCVVERRTLPGLVHRSERILSEFALLAPGRLSVSFAYPTGYEHDAVYRAQTVALDEVAPILGRAVALLLSAGVAVAPLGSCGFPLCTLRDQPEAWNLTQDLAAEHLNSRDFAPVCHACALRAQCVGPRRDYLALHGERGLVPFAALVRG